MTAASGVSAPRAAFVLLLGLLIGEGVAGWWGHSLALVADAVHNLAWSAAIALSWCARSIARRPSHHGMTFGYHRIPVIATLAHAVVLIVTGLWIVWEGLARLRAPEPADGGIMIGAALIAILVNAIAGRQGSNTDAASAGGVLLAGGIVAVTHTAIADAIVALLIGAFILRRSYRVLRDSTSIVLEGTPPGTDVSAVIATIETVSGVLDVDDLHVWMVGPGVVACSCHTVVAEQSMRGGQQVVRAVIAAAGMWVRPRFSARRRVVAQNHSVAVSLHSLE